MTNTWFSRVTRGLFFGLMVLNVLPVRTADSNWRTKAAIAVGTAGAMGLVGYQYWQYLHRQQQQQREELPSQEQREYEKQEAQKAHQAMRQKALNNELIGAVRNKNIELVHQLLENGASANAETRYFNALGEACSWGGLSIVQLLVQYGADVNHVMSNGDTPLQVSINKPEIVAFLLNHGASPLLISNAHHSPAIVYAVESPRSESLQTMDLLLRHGADANYSVPTEPEDRYLAGYSVLHVLFKPSSFFRGAQEELVVAKLNRLLRENINVNIRDDGGSTPLMFATRRGYTEAVSILLERGAQLNLQNTRGWTALMYAVAHTSFDEVGYDHYLAIMRTLISHGADMTLRDSEGRAAIDHTIDPDIIDFLIQRGSPPQRVRVHIAGEEAHPESREAELRTNIGATIAKTKNIIVLLADASSTFDEQKRTSIAQQYLRIQALAQTLQKNLHESGFETYQALFDSLVQEPVPFDAGLFERFTSVLDTIAGLEIPDNALSFTFKKLNDIRDALSAQLASKRAEQKVTACPICLEEPDVAGELTEACTKCKYKTCQTCVQRLQNPPRDEIFGRSEPKCPQCKAELQQREAGPAPHENAAEQPQQQVAQPAAEQGLWQRLQHWWRGE